MSKQFETHFNLYPSREIDSKVYIPSEQEVLEEKAEVDANEK